MSESFDPVWTEQDVEYIDMDYSVAKYQDYDIKMSEPNGGVIGVSVVAPDGNAAWWCYTEEAEKYNDVAWHIELAIKFISSLRQCEGQLELDLNL